MPALTPLPDPPSTADAANFEARADAFLAALQTLVTELNTIIGATIPAGSAAANTLTGDTLAANVLTSSLTTLGTIAALIAGTGAFSGALSAAGMATSRNTVEAPHNTVTPLVNLSNVAGKWLVVAWIAGVGAANYTAEITVLAEGSGLRVTDTDNGGLLVLSTGGSSVTVNQSSGGPANVEYAALRIG